MDWHFLPLLGFMPVLVAKKGAQLHQPTNNIAGLQCIIQVDVLWAKRNVSRRTEGEVPGKAIYRMHVSGVTSSETCTVPTLSGFHSFSATRTTLSVQLFHLRF